MHSKTQAFRCLLSLTLALLILGFAPQPTLPQITTPIMHRTIDTIIIHCSATKANQDIGAKEIDRWHRARGWLKIGYHLVIRRDGTTEFGRPLHQAGAHAKDHNANSIGICLVGGLSTRGRPYMNFNDEQMITLLHWLREYRKQFPGARIIGHNEVNPQKACPSFDVQAWLRRVPPI